MSTTSSDDTTDKSEKDTESLSIDSTKNSQIVKDDEEHKNDEQINEEEEDTTVASDDDNKNSKVTREDDHGNDSNSNNVYVKKSAVNGLVIGLIIAVGVAAFMAGAYTTNMDQQDQLTREDLDEVMAKIELKILQQQLVDNSQPSSQQPQIVRISADDDPIIGDPNAPIAIIEFSDFQCPFCERFNSQTLPALYEEYIDKGLAKLVFRDFPIQSIHPNAVVTALAAECADDQDAFKGMHDTLFDNQSEWSKSSSQDIVGVLVGYASDIGINADEFETCLVMGNHIEDIRGDLEDGRAYGVSGTPGFYIGNDDIGYVSIQGAQPFESFKRVIDAQLGMS